jgi:hypothetical protein
VDDLAALGERLFCSVGPAPVTYGEGTTSAIPRTMRFADRTERSPRLNDSRSLSRRAKMNAVLRRFLMHYGVYRRYPLGRLPALRTARP